MIRLLQSTSLAVATQLLQTPAPPIKATSRLHGVHALLNLPQSCAGTSERRTSSSAHIARASSKPDVEVILMLQPLAPLCFWQKLNAGCFLSHSPSANKLGHAHRRSTTKCRPATHLSTPNSQRRMTPIPPRPDRGLRAVPDDA
jgi:hypothetical protein